jgi:Peptidase_C39 like family
MSEQVEEFVESQMDLLRAYCKDGAVLNLNTPTTYYSQRDNYTMPGRTCNSSANAMYLDWLRRATGRGLLGGDDGYLRTVLKYGDSPDHDAQTRALKDYGFSTKFIWGDNISDRRQFVRGLLKSGIPVVVNILHRGRETAPTGGHIILLCGYKDCNTTDWGDDYFLAQDPYGTLQSNYQDGNGRLSVISNRSFVSRWQGGYRVLSNR